MKIFLTLAISCILAFQSWAQSPKITDIFIYFPYGDITNKLPVEDSLKMGYSVKPDDAHGYKLKWSVDVGVDVLQVLDDSNGIFRAVKAGFSRIKCLALDGSDVFATKDVYVVDAPQSKTGYNMTFLSGTTDGWVGEGAGDSLPAYTISMEGGFLRLVIDKAGPLDSIKKWPIYSWITPSRGFAALRLSMCPVNGLLLNMSASPYVSMKMRATSDCRLDLGYASKYSAGNASRSFRFVKASEDFSVIGFYFGGMSTDPKAKPPLLVDSSKVSHFFLNFNSGALNTKLVPYAAGDKTIFTQPNDYKGMVEIQYIKFGDLAEKVPATTITILGDSIVKTIAKKIYKPVVTPEGVSNPYVTWTTSDTNIATIVVASYDSGLYCKARLLPKTPGRIKIIATAKDGSGIVAEKSVLLYDAGQPSIAEMFTIYPNPVADVLTIDGSEDIVKAEWFSITGQLVRGFVNHGEPLMNMTADGIAPGVYLLKITTTRGEELCQKVVKQ